MVETITPVVHGGRRRRWGFFLSMHVVGATLSAAAFGATLGGVGALVAAPWGTAGLLLLAGIAGLYLAREALGLPVPVPQLRRQVPDWWRTFFPFGPASFLYGVGLGVGFLTYLSQGTLVVVSAAALASGRPMMGALLLGPFGLARGLSAIVAAETRTPLESAELVDRLARSATWWGWRAGHVAVLAAVAATTAVSAAEVAGRGEWGSAAAAVLAVAFGAAGLAKLVGGRTWRRSLVSYRLPRRVERAAATGVPVVELALASLPILGLGSTAGVTSLAVLAGFSAAIVLGRVRVGRRLDCGCFGGSRARDYRLLLVRNAALAVVAAIAWRDGTDTFVGRSLGTPGGEDLVPAALVVLGVVLTVWVGLRAFLVVRRVANP